MKTLTFAPDERWSTSVYFFPLDGNSPALLKASHALRLESGAASLQFYPSPTELREFAHLLTCAADQAEIKPEQEA